MHPGGHAGLVNVNANDHHEQPTFVEFSDTTTVIAPMPFGPGTIDIILPWAADVVLFDLRSVRTVGEGSLKAGVTGITGRSQYFDATCASIGGRGTTAATAYGAIYSKAASALNLSHKVFSSSGADVSLTDAWITTSGPNTVLRLEFTNYSAGNRTLNVWGTVEVLG